MNNKKGGMGAKFVLVLILMLASAVGGAFAYRAIDGKMAVREGNKVIERVDVSDYDSLDSGTIQEYIDTAKKDLESAKSRKEVYEILFDFNDDVSKVLTSTQKELKAAREAANQAAGLKEEEQKEEEKSKTNLFSGLLRDDNASTDNNDTDAFR